MNIHKNARLTPHGRERLARSVVERGLTPEAAARDAGVSPRTAHKWIARYKAGGVGALQDKPSRPHKLRAPTPAATVARIETLRRQRLSGARIAKIVGISPATGSAGEPGFNWATLEVEDTGIGVAEDMQERIFDRFEQVKPAALAHSGAGLGLSICRSLVSLMGGEMALSSQPGLGSTFTVRLPLMRVAAEARGEETSSDTPAAKGSLMRVLLVDDHPTNQRVVEAMLRAFDCDIVTASDGAQGLAAFQAGTFDLVLMDMSMPVMDGLAATRAIREFERQAAARRTPLAMLTAYGSDQHKREAQDAGADFHIVKPLTPVSLLAGLEKAIRASKANEAA